MMVVPEILEDPTILTKAKLVAALQDHGVDVPPVSSKKDIFVNLYLQHISPLIKKQTASSSKNISTSNSNTPNVGARKTSPPRSRRRSVSRTRNAAPLTRKLVEEFDSMAPSSQLAPSKSPSQRASRKTSPSRSGATARKKATSPHETATTPHREADVAVDSASPFSGVNIFQKKTVSSLVETRKKNKTDALPKETSSSYFSPKLFSNEKPAIYVKTLPQDSGVAYSPSTNFHHRDSSPSAPLKKGSSSKFAHLSSYLRTKCKLYLAVISFLFLLFGIFFNLSPMNYCPSNPTLLDAQNSSLLSSSNQDNFVSSTTTTQDAHPPCLPCPQNAICTDGKMSCILSYVQSGGECVPDIEIERASLRIALAIVESLDLLAGRFSCGLSTQDTIEEESLRQSVKNIPLPPQTTLSYCFENAKKIIQETPEWGIETMLLDGERVIFRSANPNRPYSCRIKQFLVDVIVYLAPYIISIFLILVVYIIYRIKKLLAKKRDSDIHDFYEKIIAHLRENYQAYQENPHTQLPYVAISHLKHEILPMKSWKSLSHAWDAALRLVRADPRVREVNKVIHGESHRAWQWIGPTLSSTPAREQGFFIKGKPFKSTLHESDPSQSESNQAPTNTTPTTTSLYPSLE